MEPVDVEKRVNVKTLAQWLEKVGHARESSNKSLTAIHVATREDEWECLQNMLEKGMDVNETDDNGWTPLHVAAGDGHFSVVELLLHVDGVDVNKADNIGTVSYTHLTLPTKA